MLYKSDNQTYVFANNKYYKLTKKDNDLIPTKEFKYELDKKTEISYKDALDLLKGNNKNLFN